MNPLLDYLHSCNLPDWTVDDYSTSGGILCLWLRCHDNYTVNYIATANSDGDYREGYFEICRSDYCISDNWPSPDPVINANLFRQFLSELGTLIVAVQSDPDKWYNIINSCLNG